MKLMAMLLLAITTTAIAQEKNPIVAEAKAPSSTETTLS